MDNKSIVYLIIVFIAAIICVSLVYYFTQEFQPTKTPGTTSAEKTAKQLEELEKLRQQAGIKPLTEEEKNSQLQILGDLQKAKTATTINTQKQIEELAKLRQLR